MRCTNIPMCRIPIFRWEPLCCAGMAGCLPAAMWKTPPSAPSICAERTALLKAVSEGCREDFLAIAIAGRGEDYCWPCGSCRQMLYEFAPDLRVLCARGDGAFVETKLSQLLPHGFGPKSLK